MPSLGETDADGIKNLNDKMTARRNSAGANFKFRRNHTMLLSSLVNSTALQELPHLQIQPYRQ